MKKLLFILPMIIMLSACSESVAVNIEAFEKNINREFNAEIMDSDRMITQSGENEDVSFWLPEDYNVCCSLFCDKKTGIIKKYTVTSEKNNPEYEKFCKIFKNTICKNNKNINISCFEADNLIITVYEDVRYIIGNENPTLKNEIKEDDLLQPVLENN